MDTASNQQQTSTAGGNSTAQSGGNTPDMMTLLNQSSLSASACGWISCLRKSGMSISYSIDKRHVPDMDQPQGNQSGGSQQNAQNKSQGNSQGSGQGGSQSGSQGGASDTMTCSGSCSVRYFDLAVGAMLLLVACGLYKGLRSMKRWL